MKLYSKRFVRCCKHYCELSLIKDYRQKEVGSSTPKLLSDAAKAIASEACVDYCLNVIAVVRYCTSD